MTIAAVSISPVGEGASVGRFVAEALRALEGRRDLRFEVGPMFTTLEGETEAIFDAVRAMQEAVFAAGAARVSTVLKLDERRDKAVGMEEKLRSVQRRLAGER